MDLMVGFSGVIYELGMFLENNRLLYAGLIILAVFVWKTEKSRRKMIVVVLLLLAVFVFNDVSMQIIRKLGYDREYYRFFWMFPLTVVLALGCLWITERMQKGWHKAAAAAGVVAVIVVCGDSYQISPNIFPDNEYMLSEDVIEVCDAIREIKEEENPRVAFNYDMNLQSRQYDASIYNVLSRQAYEQASAIGYYTEPGKYIYQMEIMKLVNAGLCESVDFFNESLIREEVDYLVVSGLYDAEEFLAAAGCREIMELTNYSIYEFIGD